MRYCIWSKILAFCETVWYDIKMSLKFVLTKNNFSNFLENETPILDLLDEREWMKWSQESMYCLIRPYFQFKSYPPNILNKYLTKMYRHFSRIRWYSMHSNIRLQSCTAFDSFKQNSKVLNYIKQNVSSNFGQFHPFQW